MSTLPPPPPNPSFGASPMPSIPPARPSPPPLGIAPTRFGPSREVRPRASWYFIVIGIGVTAAIVGVVLIVQAAIGFANKIDDFRRVDVPETETVVLEEGSYTIYMEGAGSAQVTIRKPNEQLVELRSYSSEVTYEVSGRDGRAALSFRADAAGPYRVTTAGPVGVIVAIGPGLGSGLVAGILGGIGLILAGIAFAIVGSIVVGVKRGRSRRAQFVPPFPRVPGASGAPW